MAEETGEHNVADAVEELAGMTGQGYLVSHDAFKYIGVFAKHATNEFVAEHSATYEEDSDHDPDIPTKRESLSRALKDVQRPAADARGIVKAWPHQQIVTVHVPSEIVVEAIGREPSQASYAGAGFTADARHDGNVEKLADEFDVDLGE